MSKLKRKRGVTLIELIIAFGIFGVIISLIFSFFFSNKKSLNNAEIKSSLQYEAKVVMDKLSSVAMEASNGKFQEDIVTGDKIISFNTVDSITGNLIEDGVKFIFHGDNVALTEKGLSSVELCKTTDLKISVYTNITDKQGIKVKLVFENKDVAYSIEDNFTFRNSHID